MPQNCRRTVALSRQYRASTGSATVTAVGVLAVGRWINFQRSSYVSDELSGNPPFAYRLATWPAIGYALLLCWQKRWLPTPSGEAQARLRDGRIIRCNLRDRTQRTMYLGLFEPAETRLIASMLGPGDTFVDVGAHIGWFSVVASQRVGPAGQVHAFEPFPANSKALEANFALNGVRNARILQTALSDQPGTLSLSDSDDSGAVTALQWSAGTRIDVPMTTLDTALPDQGSIALMKVDVEGWEAHVLRGAQRTLSRTRNVLIEINIAALTKAGSSPEEIVGLLSEAGFTTHTAVARRGLRRFQRDGVSNLLASRDR